MATGLDASSIFFKGADGNECETFIAAIEELAFSEGWSEDRRRMLLFARSRLRNTALRWFAKLDTSVKNDWDLFVEALFDQYPPVASHRDEVVEALTPTWSTTTFSPALSTSTLTASQVEAPAGYETDQKGPQMRSDLKESLNAEARSSLRAVPAGQFPLYDASNFRIHVGKLRVVYEDKMPPSWIWKGSAPKDAILKRLHTHPGGTLWYEGSGAKCATWDRSDALLVSFLPGAEPHPIACLDTEQAQRALGVVIAPGWPGFYPLAANNTANEVTKQATFRMSDGYTWWTPSYKTVSSIWNVLNDGTLQATLSEFAQSPIPGTVAASIWTTTTVHVDISGLPILFAKDDANPPAANPDTGRPLIKARIVFEPL